MSRCLIRERNNDQVEEVLAHLAGAARSMELITRGVDLLIANGTASVDPRVALRARRLLVEIATDGIHHCRAAQSGVMAMTDYPYGRDREAVPA